MWTVLLLLSTLSWSMPDMKMEKDWGICKNDSDCIVAGDACRSCGRLQFINRKFKEEFIQKDNRQRIKAGVVRACEACQTSSFVLHCLKNICSGIPKKSP